MITAIKNDMIRVISRYMKIEKDAVRITMDAGSFFRWNDLQAACTAGGYTYTVHIQQGALLICFLTTILETTIFV